MRLTQWIYTIADRMEKYYRKLIKNYFTSIPITYPPSTCSPIQELSNQTKAHRSNETQESAPEELKSMIAGSMTSLRRLLTEKDG